MPTPAYKKARATSLRNAGAEGHRPPAGPRTKSIALIGPTMPPAWKIDAVNGDQISGGGAGSLAAVAGYPHLTVPMGLVKGLPVGLSFIGPKWSRRQDAVARLCLRAGARAIPGAALPAVDRERAPGRARAPPAQAVSLSPAIAPTMTRIRTARTRPAGSPKKAIPTITVPTAPIPPHTA